MDDGLVCELNCTYDTRSCTGLVISNPVTKARRALLAPSIHWGTVYDPPVMVPVVDKIARSFVVFLIHNLNMEIRMLLFDSATNEWRDLKSPPEEFGALTVLSAVFFRGALYAVFEKTCRQFGNLRLLRYTPEENLWREVSAPLTPPGNLSTSPALLVVGNRLIMMLWLADPSSLDRGSMYDASFQMLEILVPENASRRLFCMSVAALQDHFGEDPASVPYGVPSIDSNGFCTSVTLMSTSSGKLVTFDLRRRVASGLPPHPLGQGPLEDVLDPTGFSVYATYVCRYMNLSLRHV